MFYLRPTPSSFEEGLNAFPVFPRRETSVDETKRLIRVVSDWKGIEGIDFLENSFLFSREIVF